MTVSSDCINSFSTLGENLTPVPLIRSIQAVSKIDLDIASSAFANQVIDAEVYYDFLDDGYAQPIHGDTVFCNPPGTSYTGGTVEQRKQLLTLIEANAVRKKAKEPQVKIGVGKPPFEGIREISASDWGRKLFEAFKNGEMETLIYLLYRSGSSGSVPKEMYYRSTFCISCATGHEAVSGSGRFSFDGVVDGQRVAQTANTQASFIFICSYNSDKHVEFAREFAQYGAICQGVNLERLM